MEKSVKRYLTTETLETTVFISNETVRQLEKWAWSLVRECEEMAVVSFHANGNDYEAHCEYNTFLYTEEERNYEEPEAMYMLWIMNKAYTVSINLYIDENGFDYRFNGISIKDITL